MEWDPRALVERTLSFVRARGLLPSGGIVVAVSGGQDSICMLDILNSLKGELGIDLHVAHLNHMFRGAQSASEAEYVGELANRMGLKATVAAIDVPAYRARHRLGKQVAARYARLQFLVAVAGRVGAERIAVGHTSDDAVETFLLNLLRGSGLAGLGGLSPARGLDVGQLGPKLEASDWQSEPMSLPEGPLPEGPLPMVVRPILGLFRAETERYCQERGLAFRRDPSNLDIAYLRNRIRVELLPLLERYSPGLKERLRNSADLLADDYALVSSLVEREWERLARQGIGRVEFDLGAWEQLDGATRRHLLRKAVTVLAGSLEGLSRVHIDLAEANIRYGSVGSRVDLPSRLFIEKGYSTFWLEMGPTAIARGAIAPPSPVALTVPGSVALPGGVLEARVLDVEGGSWSEYCSGSRWEACLDADRVGPTLEVRRRAPGDRFVPLGMDTAKKLHDFLIDEKVPRQERDRLPLVATPGDIVWVVGYRMNDRFKVTLNTKRILKLSYEPILSVES